MELNLYAISVDLLLIGVFGYTVYRAWKRGFVGAAAGLLSFIGAWIAAGMFSYILDGFLQRTLFDSLVTDMIGSVISNAVMTAGETAETAAQALNASLESIRAYADTFGISLPTETLPQLSLHSAADSALIAEMTEQLSAPIAEKLSFWAAHLILFLIAYLLLRFVFGVLDIVARLPILHQANSLLGGICGVLLGAGYAWIAARLLAFVLGIFVARGDLPPEFLDGTVFGALTGT